MYSVTEGDLRQMAAQANATKPIKAIQPIIPIKMCDTDGWRWWTNTSRSTLHCYRERGFRIGSPAPVDDDLSIKGIIHAEEMGLVGVYVAPDFDPKSEDGERIADAAREATTITTREVRE